MTSANPRSFSFQWMAIASTLVGSLGSFNPPLGIVAGFITGAFAKSRFDWRETRAVMPCYGAGFLLLALARSQSEQAIPLLPVVQSVLVTALGFLGAWAYNQLERLMKLEGW